MFAKLLKKLLRKPAPSLHDTTQTSPASPPSSTPTPVQTSIDWEARLQAAQGDDAALLTLCRAAPRSALKQAALAALHSEEALQTIERETRKSDQGLHRLAKQRLDALRTRRHAAKQAATLITTAQTLLQEPVIPANRLVDLEHAWQAIDPQQLDAQQSAEFKALQTRLQDSVRERNEQLRQAKLWQERAQQTIAALQQANAPETRTQLMAQAESLRQSAPSPAVTPDSQRDLHHALTTALQTAQATPDPTPPASPTPEVTEASLEPIAQAPLATPTPTNTSHFAEQEALRTQLEALLKASSHALEQGEIQQAQVQLAALHAACGEAPLHSLLQRTQQQRLHSLEQELKRLQSWQRWSREQARDALIAEAEALAASVAPPPAHADHADQPTPPTLPTLPTLPALPLKAHAKAIEALRARWKKLGQTSHTAQQQAQWKRFDAALQIAYAPLLQQQQTLAKQREVNLQQRQELLATLTAISTPEAHSDWRQLQQQLEQVHSAWRKLGPLEHTVPHAARAALQEAWQAQQTRLETPLQAARNQAEQERRLLIAQAQTLRHHQREDFERLRHLQQHWQQQAKALPLARSLENTLWAEFKQACDALYSARQTAHEERQAEWQAHRETRENLLSRLHALNAENRTAKEELASIEKEWRQAGALEKHLSSEFETRFKTAKLAFFERQNLAEQQRQQARLTALQNHLALCAAYENSHDTKEQSTHQQHWQSLDKTPLPNAWQQALQQRFMTAHQTLAADAAKQLNHRLLQLEIALEQPSPTAFQSERQTLKLHAMKQALEERHAVAATEISSCFTHILAQPRPDTQQSERLAALLPLLCRT